MPRSGLDTQAVTRAAAEMADEVGLHALNMTALAERLGVRPPSLYKHVTGLDDLIRRIAILAVSEMAESFERASDRRIGSEALKAIAHAFRTYVRDHPGRYAASAGLQLRDEHDPVALLLEKTVNPLRVVVRGYDLDPADEVHALRMLRSSLQGFVTLEIAGGFAYDTTVDSSFEWMIDSLDIGLRAQLHARAALDAGATR